jgi:AcrR family transcriptional regulator
MNSTTIRYDKRGVRKRLLETTATHFARDERNVDAISLAVGFAEGTLYNYFDSKEQLFAAVVHEACRRAAALYGAAEASPSVRRAQ